MFFYDCEDDTHNLLLHLPITVYIFNFWLIIFLKFCFKWSITLWSWTIHLVSVCGAFQQWRLPWDYDNTLLISVQFSDHFITKPSYYISQHFLCPAVFIFRRFFLLNNLVLKPSNNCQLEDPYPCAVICHTRSLFTNPCLLMSKHNWAIVIYKEA